MLTLNCCKLQVRGLYLNCGLSSKGVQMSGGVGRELAALVDTGATTVDAFGMDPARFNGEEHVKDREWVRQTCQEAQVLDHSVFKHTRLNFQCEHRVL